MRLECTELREFMDLVGEDKALQALSSFSVKRNPDVENFIRTNAVAYEKSDNARTYLMTNENDDILRISYSRSVGRQRLIACCLIA